MALMSSHSPARGVQTAATSEASIGSPAILRTSSRVVEVDCRSSTVALEDESKVSCGPVLGADGVSVCFALHSFLDFKFFKPPYQK